MIRKPFRPPTFVRPDSRNGEPPQKKRRTSSDNSKKSRKPLVSVRNYAASAISEAGRYYTVLWRKYNTKKNKTWDGDGLLSIVGGYAVLADIDTRKELGRGPCGRPLLPGSTMSVGGKEIEIDGVISKEDYFSGRPFLGITSQTSLKESEPSLLEDDLDLKIISKAGKMSQSYTKHGKNPDADPPPDETEEAPAETTLISFSKPHVARKHFKTPLLSCTIVPRTNSKAPQPRHDPNQTNALIMKRPATCPKDKQIVDVVVDPILGKHLRDHQRDGVKFLYECIMGMRSEGEGAILADEMGLGKTLQTITLLWTLLKQNPIYENAPVVNKALIVCPAGLVENWRREFRKWLGNERVGVFVYDNRKKKLTNFTMGKAYNIMIIGYEMLRVVQEELKRGSGIDIVIADEGHRLKTANNKAMLAIESLNTERRIILSGTPLQNDLGEFFTAIDFVNPGLLGKRSAFKREFEAPIVRSRQPYASEAELEKGEARWKELVSLTSRFMIRRTAEVLTKYLPPKTEHIVFCKPTVAQAAAYRSILKSPIFSVALGNSDMALQLISVLKKVCNSPSLLKSKEDDTPSEMLQTLLPLIPPNVVSSHASSVKLRVLDSLLHRIYTSTPEKVVIVSNYTTTLDMIERLLTSLSYSFLRLDGSTPASKRQALVEKFNKTDKKASFAFLLSAKSGGVGLNLIGASRIVLFDIDWNPATDLQAMARIHRDGQKLPCKIYRFLVQGALDEKIYQRQVMKQGLANAVVDNKASTSTFSREELQNLFKLDERDQPQTHGLLGCMCEGRGGGEVEDMEAEESEEGEEEDALPSLQRASEVDMDEQEARIKNHRARGRPGDQPKLRMLMEYAHVDTKFIRSVQEQEKEDEVAVLVDDDVLLEVLKEEDCRVSFLLTKSSS
ncbi:DNA repair and recombination protein RAD26 [Zopfia rhizophila CBS 207.26]|uniref:DNA repair and recombination protein RAD26 n=1 Tax=Zopfia rhizophila CBS 207.26 TaxID=1314779 RepID=A0A6A6DW10_9PEZI|nr:DNA repair and recombination protein RAD26 [Zopfia rhizophila CBS 207.26]